MRVQDASAGINIHRSPVLRQAARAIFVGIRLEKSGTMTHEPFNLSISFDVITAEIELFLRDVNRVNLKSPGGASAGLMVYPFWDPSWGNCGELRIQEKTAEITTWSSAEPLFPSAKDTLLFRLMARRARWSERHPTRDDLEKKFDERAIELEEALAYYQEPVGDPTATPSEAPNINAPELLTSWLTSLRFPREDIEGILLWAQAGIRNHQISLSKTRDARYERMLKSIERHLREKGLWKPVAEQLQEVGSAEGVSVGSHLAPDPFKAEEYAKRKGFVAQAKQMKTPTKTWKQIADELDIPERTLREWRHNPRYQ